MNNSETIKSLHSRKRFFGMLGTGVIGAFILKNFTFTSGIGKMITPSAKMKILVKPEPLAVKRQSAGKNDARA